MCQTWGDTGLVQSQDICNGVKEWPAESKQGCGQLLRRQKRRIFSRVLKIAFHPAGGITGNIVSGLDAVLSSYIERINI